MSHVDGATARAARRRRECWLRMHWRHEQLTLQMLLATFQHHSAPRGQTTARSGEWGNEVKYTAMFREHPPQVAGTQYFAMDVDEVPAAGGSRPDRLAPVSGPQERVQRHIVEQPVDPVRGLPFLDAPVPQKVEQLVDVLNIIDSGRGPAPRRSSRVADGGEVGGSARARGRHPGTRHERTWPRLVPGCSSGKGGGRRVPGAVLRLWASLPCSDKFQHFDPRFSSSTEFLLAVVLQRRVPTMQTVQPSVEIPQVPFSRLVLTARCCA